MSRLCAVVVLAGVIFTGVHSRATPAMAPLANNGRANNKVIVYPMATETVGQLQRAGITDVRDYGSYWLVEATDAQLSELTRLYGARAVVENGLNEIRLTNLSFDTRNGDPSVPVGLREAAGPGPRLRIVQFCGPIVPNWLRLLEQSGARVVSYVPRNAYLVWMDSAAEKRLAEIQKLNGPIQWIGAYHPYYKIQKGLLNVDKKNKDSLVDLRIGLVGGPGMEGTTHGLQDFGLIQSSYDNTHQTVARMTVPVSAVPRIAQLPGVLWMEKIEPKILLDEVQDLILAEQTSGPGYGPTNNTGGATGFRNYLGGVSALFTNYIDFLTNNVGGGQFSFYDPTTYPIVDVADTGIDASENGAVIVNNSFAVLGFPSFGYRLWYVEPGNGYFSGASVDSGCSALNNNFVGSEDFYGHGTRVASVVGGFDAQTNLFSVLDIYSTIVTQLFAVHYTCNDKDTETNATVIATQPCSFTTNIIYTCAAGGEEIDMNLALPVEIIITQRVDVVHQDPSGFHYGMGVSPFGRLGSSRIWRQSADTTGNPPHVRFLPAPQPFTTCMENLFPVLLWQSYLSGGRIQNNSWDEEINRDGSNGGQYTTDSQTYDIGVRDASLVGSNGVAGPSPLNQEYIEVFAATRVRGPDLGQSDVNGGFLDMVITAPATAKNVITVGDAETVRLDGSGCDFFSEQDNSLSLSQSSEFGPTADGRFKPEIVAPGTSIYAAKSLLAAVIDPVLGIVPTVNQDASGFEGGSQIFTCTETNLYCVPPSFFDACFPNNSAGIVAPGISGDQFSCGSGSSYAAPAVSGAIQLMWWYFEHRLTNEVGRALLQPSPAMAKAYLCNSARYLPLADPQTGALDTLPSNAQGMGELDLAMMFDGVQRAIRDESSPRAVDSALITTNPAVQQTYFSQSGQTYEMSGKIASNGLPFRVTLAWTDAAGTPLAAQELVNDLDLQVTVGGVTYHGNNFSQNVSSPNSHVDTINNVESVFLNPPNITVTNTLTGGITTNGIAAISNGAPFQVVVRASNIAGTGVPNVGEALVGGTNVPNQDFALVVYNAATNTLSDVPNLKTNNSCQTAINLVGFPFSFSNNLSTAVYGKVFPSPTAGTGGSEEFFRIPLPTAGTVFTLDMSGSGLNAILSVWEAQVVPQTILVRGDCGALTELISQPATLPQVPQITFTADGSNDYFIVAEGKDGATGPLVLTVNRNCLSLSMTPSELPSTFPGKPYSAQLFVTGGQAPVTFAVTSGSLPPGLTLSSTSGLITGSSTTTGTYTFTITATDGLGCTISITYTVSVTCPSLSLSPASLPSAPVGQPYNQTITASGAQGTPTFSLLVGPLPPGLQLTPSGSITGTPTAFGVYTFEVTATNGIGCTGSKNYSISVTCPMISVSPGALPQGREFASYGPVTLTASGGTAPYTFAQTGGSLPAGITLSTNGVISGTPTSVSSTFIVTATDAFNCPGTMTYTLSLIDPLQVTLSATLPSGIVGQAYNGNIAASGGVTPYSFVVSGSLPSWLTTKAAGSSLVLNGTPTSAGSFTFGVTATDSQSDVGQTNYTISVTSVAQLDISASFSPRTVTVGSNLTCTVKVTNHGPSSATGVTVNNILAAGATFVSSSFGCTAAGNTVVCNVGSLPAGGTVPISYVIQATQVGAISVTSSVTAADSTTTSTTANGTAVPPYFVAVNPAKIVDQDGDIVSVSLKGAGSIAEVGLLGSVSNGPIDHINLTGTGASSSLTISVKKAKGGSGNGLVNVGSITSDGGLKSINGSGVNVTGEGIQVAGDLGTLKANALLASGLVVSGSGGIGTLQLNVMSNSVCTVTNGMVKTVNVGVYVGSQINAEAVKTVKLGTVTTENGNQSFGIQVQQPGGTVSVSSPRLKWKITPSSAQSTNDFQVAQP
ncbi:MAG TPA: putative Ig domain-containing protein [Verrucomicrobiae bacterium]|nr:putative Ig domain-containing protein [Verrucomicrobiae bacterium]